MTTTAPPRPRHDGDARTWLALAGFVVGCEAAGLVGLPFNTGSDGGWYDSLTKPSFNPPSWVFGPVWTTLYALMAVAAWRVWRSADRRRRAALTLFAVQLVLNAAWSPLFFGAHRAGWALVDLCALWLALVATIASFARIDRLATALLVPYLGWVTFAGVLNAEIVRLN